MSAVFDVPTFENQVANRLNMYVSAYAHSTEGFNVGYEVSDYPFMGKMSSEVVTTVLNPGTHPNDSPITFGGETPESLASRGVIEFAESTEP